MDFKEFKELVDKKYNEDKTIRLDFEYDKKTFQSFQDAAADMEKNIDGVVSRVKEQIQGMFDEKPKGDFLASAFEQIERETHQGLRVIEQFSTEYAEVLHRLEGVDIRIPRLKEAKDWYGLSDSLDNVIGYKRTTQELEEALAEREELLAKKNEIEAKGNYTNGYAVEGAYVVHFEKQMGSLEQYYDLAKAVSEMKLNPEVKTEDIEKADAILQDWLAHVAEVSPYIVEQAFSAQPTQTPSSETNAEEKADTSFASEMKEEIAQAKQELFDLLGTLEDFQGININDNVLLSNDLFDPTQAQQWAQSLIDGGMSVEDVLKAVENEMLVINEYLEYLDAEKIGNSAQIEKNGGVDIYAEEVALWGKTNAALSDFIAGIKEQYADAIGTMANTEPPDPKKDTYVVDDSIEKKNEELATQEEKVDSLKEAYHELGEIIKESMAGEPPAQSADNAQPQNKAREQVSVRHLKEDPSYYLNSVFKKQEKPLFAKTDTQILSTLESGALEKGKGLELFKDTDSIQNTIAYLQQFYSHLEEIREILTEEYEIKVKNNRLMQSNHIMKQLMAISEASTMATDAIAQLVERYHDLQASAQKASEEQDKEAEKPAVKEVEKPVVKEAEKPVAKEAEKPQDEQSQYQYPAVNLDKDFESIADLERRINDLKGDIEQMRNEASSDNPSASMTEYSEEISLAEKELKRLEEIHKNLVGEKTQSPIQSYDDLLLKIQEVQNQINSLRSQGKELPLGDVQGTANEIQSLESELKNLMSIKNTIDGGSVGSKMNAGLQQEVQEAAQATSGFSNIKDAVAGASSAFAQIKSGIAPVVGALKSVGSAAITAGTYIANFTKVGLQGLWSAAQKVGSVLGSIGSKGFGMLKKGVDVAKTGLQGLISKFKSISGNTTKNFLKSFSSIKSMLKRRVKRTFISAIFNQAKEGLQQLAKYDSEFNAAMSSIKNSSKQVAGNLSVTLGNLVTMIAPAITSLLNLLNTLLEKINAIFALITGKTTFATAKKGTDDYAKSLKKAGGAAKDLNSQVYGFDELTKQQDNSGSGGSKIEYGTADVDGILGGLKDSIQEIIDAFKNGEFEKAGELIGKQLNKIISKFRDFVQSLRSKAKTWAKNIGDTINGLVKGINWYEVGGLIGDGINLVNDTLNTFLTTVKWDKLGKAFGTKVKGIFDTVEWDLVGKTFANGFNVVIKFLKGAVTEIPWGDIGTDWAIAIQTFFSTIDWDGAVQAIDGGINGLIKLFYNLVTGVDWGKITDDLLSHLDEAIKGIDWEGLGTLISTSINTLVENFGKLVTSDTMVTLASKLGTLVNNVLSEIDWSQLVLDVVLGIAKIAEAFSKFVENCNLEEITNKLGDAINDMFDPEKGGATFETAVGFVTTGIDSIVKAFQNLIRGPHKINWANIRKVIVNGINSLITNVDWAGLLSTIGTMILEIVNEFWKLIGELNLSGEGGLAEQIAEGINGMFKLDNGEVDTDRFVAFAENLSNALKNILKSIGTFIQKTDWEAIGTAIGTALANIDWIGLAGDILSLLWNALVAAAEGAMGLMGTILRKIFGIEVVDDYSAEWADGSAQTIVDNLDKGMMSKKELLLNSAWMFGTGYGDTIIDAMTANSDEETNRLYRFIEGIMGDDPPYEAASKYGIVASDAIFAGWEQGIESGDFQEKFKEKFGSSTQDMVDYISNLPDWQSIKTFFSEMGIEITDEMAQSMYQANGDIGQAGKSMFVELVNSASPEETKAIFARYGIEVSDAFAESITGTGSANIGAAMRLMAMGVDEETIAAMDASHLSENLDAYMKSSGKSIEDIALMLMDETGEGLKELSAELGIDVGKAMGDKVPEATKEALEAGKTAVADAAQGIVEVAKASASDIKGAEESNKELGDKSTDALENSLKDGTSSIQTATEEVTKTVKDPINKLPDEVKPFAQDVIKYIVEALADGDGTVSAAIEAVAKAAVDKAKEILSGEEGTKIAVTFLNGIRDGMNGSGINTRIQNIATTARAYAESTLSNSNGYTIGSNMIIGMINGMNAYGQMLVNTIAHICNVSADTARQILGIASPSKVFAEIGSYTMEGMTIGLENTGKNAISAVGNIASAIIDEAQDTDAISMQVNAMTSGLDVVEGKMERIAQIFSDIASTIADMGGLEIPTVASGQVIPYRTKIADSMPGIANNMSESNLEDALYNAISRAMTGSSGEQDINITLQLDGRKVAEVVSKYQRRQARAMGV